MNTTTESGARTVLDLRTIWDRLHTLERRFLDLQGRLSLNAPTQREFLESADLVIEVQRVYQSLQEERGRRDLGFGIHRRLTVLEQWCRWLVRKIAEEYLFRVRLGLERDLKAMLPPTGVALYTRISELEDLSREIAELSEKTLADRLWSGELVSQLIDQLEALQALPTTLPLDAGVDLPFLTS